MAQDLKFKDVPNMTGTKLVRNLDIEPSRVIELNIAIESANFQDAELEDFVGMIEKLHTDGDYSDTEWTGVVFSIGVLFGMKLAVKAQEMADNF